MLGKTCTEGAALFRKKKDGLPGKGLGFRLAPCCSGAQSQI